MSAEMIQVPNLMHEEEIPAANVGPTPPLFPSAKVVLTHIPSDDAADVECLARNGQHALNSPVDALVSGGAPAVPDAKPIGTALTHLLPSPYQCRVSWVCMSVINHTL
ncbi:TPA: hypothetical protein ACH3X2_011190 [Trebouxia sp. C0005]